MDRLKAGMGTLRRQSSNRKSGIFQSYKPKTPRELYYLYKDEFGFPPKEAHHLVTYAKTKDYILKERKAEEMLHDPPNPPKRKLDTGGYEWSDDGDDDSSLEDENDNNSDDDHSDSNDNESINEQKTNILPITPITKQRSIGTRKHSINELKKTQLIAVNDVKNLNKPLTNNINISEDTIENKDDNNNNKTLKDISGYQIKPFTNQIILYFHLDISYKQWPKSSRTFLSAINEILLIKRRDYNILTINKFENQIKIAILFRKFNNKWPNIETNIRSLKLKISTALGPLTKSFKDSTHLLKMLRKLQFGEIDISGKNQVDRKEFDAYFNENSVEPLDSQVLSNLFKTLDADGDGEITALEFFKWKTTFSSKTLAEMFPIISCKIFDSTYSYCLNTKLYLQISSIYKHCYNQLQDFPFQLCINDIFTLYNMNKYKKFESFQQSKLLFLIYKNGISDSDINNILTNGINKKGKYFDGKGMYGQGYYFTSNIQYALSSLFYNKTSEFNNDNNNNNNDTLHSFGHLVGKHSVQLSTFDSSQSLDFSHGEFHILICLVNLGKINYIREFERGKKIKGSNDSNCVQRLIGDWNECNSGKELFGRPESHFETEYNKYYEGNCYDCYIIKSHERILPKYLLTLKRIKQCFIWMDEKYENIVESFNKLIFRRAKQNKLLANIIYGGDNNNRIMSLIRLKMKYNNVFLLRFAGLNVNVNRTVGGFIKFIKGNISNISVKIYPITIIYNIETKQQLWNLILRDDKNHKLSNINGSPQEIFKYIMDNLGGKKYMKFVNKNNKINGSVSMIVISIKFVTKQKTVNKIVSDQVIDKNDLQKEFNEKSNYYYDKSIDFKKQYSEHKNDIESDIESDSSNDITDSNKPPIPRIASGFKIQITSADGNNNNNNNNKKKGKSKKQLSESEKMKLMLDSERIDKLLELKLPHEVSEYLGNPKLDYKLPSDSKESMGDLERDIRKMHQGLHDQSINQRKYSKLSILKYYDCLCAIYDKYCRLGGDKHWLTLNGYLWMLNDSLVPDTNNSSGVCTIAALEQLFKITYKMHHRLKTRHQSKHKIQASAMYGDDNFYDDDPWTGIWKQCDYKDNDTGTPITRAQTTRTPRTPSANNDFIYKLRKIGDLRLSGCINNIEYADMSGAFSSLNYKKSELIIKYKQRKRAGTKRVWNCELIAPDNILDTIKMKVSWIEMDEKGKGASKQKSGKFYLEKTNKLTEYDKDLPKDLLIGLSKHEFFDCILSIAVTKYGLQFEYQFICVDKLCDEHFNSYLYKNIIQNNKYLISKNENIKKLFKDRGLILRKLFKIYASLDSDDSADDDGLGVDEWCAFATDVLKNMKLLNKKIWSNGGKPNFNEMKASFILSKSDIDLDIEEVDYLLFQKCIVNLTSYIFKYKPNIKYKIKTFDEKLKLVFKACEKMQKTSNGKRDSANFTFKKLKLLQTGNSTPKSRDSDNNNSIPKFYPNTSNTPKRSSKKRKNT